MKKLVITVIIVFAAIVYAGSKNDDPSIKLVQEAERFSSYINNADYMNVASMMEPRMVKAIGGQSSAAELVESIFTSEMLVDSFLNMEFKNPDSIIIINGTLAAVVPYDSTLKMDGSLYTHESFYIATSPDEGENWYFSDGNGVHKDNGANKDKLLNFLIPGYGGELTFPSEKTPYENSEQ